MSCNKLKLSALVFVLLLPYAVLAQDIGIRFDRITIKNGLSQSSVNCVLQDNKGFIWLGTQDGLNKFNGYTFDVFRHDPYDSTSLIDNYIRAIHQDTAGYIWIGTDNGLCRFDPLTNLFAPFDSGEGPGNQTISCLAESANGTLWIGTALNGLYSYNKGTRLYKHYTSSEIAQLKSDEINAFYFDSADMLWIGTRNGGLTTYSEGKFNPSPFEFSNSILTIREDDEAHIWIGSDQGLAIYNKAANSTQYFMHDAYNDKSIANNNVRSIFQDHSGNVWIGTDGGLEKAVNLNGELNFMHHRHNEFINTSLVSNLVQVVYEDASGTIWVGTNNGLSKFDPTKQGFHHYQHIPNDDQSLSDNNIWSILEDSDHNLWVGSRNGLDIIYREPGRFKHFANISHSRIYTANPSVFSLFRDSRNRIWAGTTDGLYIIKHKQGAGLDIVHVNYCTKFFKADIENRVYTIYEDKKNNIWIGTRNGLSCIYPDNSYRYFVHSDSLATSLSNNTVRAVYQDSRGQLWIGTEKGLNKAIYRNDSIAGFKHFFYKYGAKNCLSNDMVLSICEASDGLLWLGTYGGGLNRFSPTSGTFEQFTEKDGLPNNVIYGVLSDNKDNLWMSTNQGLVFFNMRAEEFKTYKEDDGLQSNEFNTGAYYKNAEGTLFFGGINGLNAFNPSAIQINPFPPIMAITGLKIYNKSVPLLDGFAISKEISSLKTITLMHEQDHFELEFSAMHYLSPHRNRYSFKMVGFDEDWIDAGTRRTATYTNLDPGEYIFLVKGCNSDGVWSEEVASLKIIITPPFWQTWWFRLIIALIACSLIYSWIKYRERNIRLQKEFLEEQVEIRTEEIVRQKEKIENQKNALESEKAKVDSLLLNILPESTVEELKKKGRANARHYRKVSVMFADVQNFTRLSVNLRPNQLIEQLDKLFIKFDEIISKHNIEKIKTIGDAYMCAGGVPIRNRSNPIEIILASLEIQRYMAKLKAAKKPGEPLWEIRIGVHSGPVTAGILGKKRFAYDIWGDTVNVANRMENAGEVGKVNISAKTYASVRDFFICESRGKINVKNKGEIKMYFVNRILPELSVDEEGTEPNELFWQYVNLKLFSSINYKKAEKHIIQLLKSQLAPNLYYHCLEHTLDVCKAVERIGLAENIVGEDLFLLKTAALFHDAGFIRQYEDHETASAEVATEVLPDYGYTPEQIETVGKLILATRIPQNPTTHLEEIICDADLDYLGRNDFNKISNALMKELNSLKIIEHEKQWDEIQINFLKNHTFFTKTARETRQKQKRAHLQLIINRYKQDEY